MNRDRRLMIAIATGVLTILALAFAILLSKPGPSASSSRTSPPTGSGFDGAALPSGAPAPDFTLDDQHGQAVSLRSLRGRPVVMAFLYTSCDSTCTVIAQQIRGALDETSGPVSVLLISADPATDTPSGVGRFLEAVSLTGRVRYLSGPRKRLQQVWRDYHVTPASAGRRAFDRHASVLLVDPQGRERVLYGQEQLTPESLSHDIRALQTG